MRRPTGCPVSGGVSLRTCGRPAVPADGFVRHQRTAGLNMVVQVLGAPKLVSGIPRFGDVENYSDSFGFQWNRFAETQLHPSSAEMLWRLTAWKPQELSGLDILEVGSGAGRFSRVILEETGANLYSVDYSSAVDANWRNNGHIARERFHLFQASIYEMPFPDNSFDKV